MSKDLFALTQTPKGKKPIKYEIDWNHPLTKGLVSCWDMRFSPKAIDIASNSHAELRSLARIKPSYGDTAFHSGAIDTSTNHELCGADIPDSATGNLDFKTDFTFFAKIRPNPPAVFSYDTIIGKRDGSGYQYQFRIVFGGFISLLLSGGSRTSTLAVKNNEWQTISVNRNASAILFNIDGVFESVEPKTYTSGKNINVTIGNTGSNNQALQADMSILLAYNRDLSVAELSSLHDDPYQFLKPASLQDAVYPALFGTSSGAATIAAHVMHHFKQMRQ